MQTPSVSENYRHCLATVRGPGGTFDIRFGFISSLFIVRDRSLNQIAQAFSNYEEALRAARTLAVRQEVQ